MNTAGEYGRSVYAVPGRIESPRSAGCHDLIKDGAQLCESAEDVLSEFTHLKAIKPESVQMPMLTLSPVEQSVCRVLSHEQMQQDEIIRQSQQPAALVSVALLQLEVKKTGSAASWETFYASLLKIYVGSQALYIE